MICNVKPGLPCSWPVLDNDSSLLVSQFNGYTGRMVFAVKAAIVQHLRDNDLLTADCVPREHHAIPWQLHGIA